MAESKLLLAYPNRAKDSTLSGGSWESSLPLDNLKDRRTRKLARSTDATLASTQFTADLSSERSIGVVAIRNHNLSNAAKIKISIATDSGFTNIVYDSGFVDVYGSVFDSLDLPWESPEFWLGLPSAEDLALFTSLYFQVIDNAVIGQYIKVEIDDTTNSDGYIHIGSLFAADTFQPEVNFEYGASNANSNRTRVSESVSGFEQFDVRDKKRVINFTLDHMSYNEGYQKLFDSTQSLGISEEILVSLDPTDEINLYRNSMVGRYVAPRPMTFPRYNQTSMDVTIQETF